MTSKTFFMVDHVKTKPKTRLTMVDRGCHFAWVIWNGELGEGNFCPGHNNID